MRESKVLALWVNDAVKAAKDAEAIPTLTLFLSITALRWSLRRTGTFGQVVANEKHSEEGRCIRSPP